MSNTTSRMRSLHSIFRNGLPSIGVLVEELSGVYQKGIWPGIVEASRKNNLNCLCFTGGTLLKSPVDIWQYQRNILYDFAETCPLSGLIVFGSLASYVEDRHKREFINRFAHLPLVTMTEVQEGIPAVYVDNKKGMRELLRHLVEVHACRRFAFVTGPAWNSEAEERLSLLTSCLAGYGLTLSPDGIFPGNFTRESGARAARELAPHIDDFDVLVTADDQSAIGAIEAFAALGIRIPEQIAVTGFDDIEESSFISPPLTTVHQPLFELGALAVTSLVRRMRRENVNDHLILDAPVVVRQSCGCYDSDVVHLQRKDNEEAPAPVPAVLSALSAEGIPPDNVTEQLITIFFRDLPLRRDDRFLKQVIAAMEKPGIGERDIAHWAKTVSALNDFCHSWIDPAAASFASSLLLEASKILAETAFRSQGRKRLDDARSYLVIHDIGSLITTSLTLSEMIETIAVQLPRLGIRNFHVALYVQESPGYSESRLLLSVVNGNNVPLATDTPYRSADLLPGPLIESNGPAVCIIEPLYFQSSQFGFALFEAGSVRTDVFPIIGGYLSSTLHSRLLIERIEHQKETLRETNKELVELRSKEYAYIESVKGELKLGQKIQLSFLPQEIPQPRGWEMDAFFMPAREVSGDFYDIFQVDPSTLFLVIGDVSGKDIGAALFMSRIQILLRAITERAFSEGKPLSDTMKAVNEYITRQYRHAYATVMFATMFYGFLDLKRGVLRYINAGHPSPVIINNAVVKIKLPQTGPAIGIDGSSVFHEKEYTLLKNDLLLAYTDGVTEAKNTEGEFFSGRRLSGLLLQKNPSATALIKRIRTELHDHMRNASPYDDITMLALYRQ